MATMRAPDSQNLAEERHLAQANRHISEAEARISRQSALIARLAAHGSDTSESEGLLQEMERTLDLMYTHRAQILEKLSR